MNPEVLVVTGTQVQLPLYAQAILVTLVAAGWLIPYIGCFAILLLSAGDLHMHRYCHRYLIIATCLVLAIIWPVILVVGMLALALILSSNAICSLHYAHKQQDTDY